MAVGLSILLGKSCANLNHSPHRAGTMMVEPNTLIVRPVIKLSETMMAESPVEAVSCFLKSCQLCRRKLKPEDDIYMYKGDEGYCSEECRSRQIRFDEEEEERRSRMKQTPTRRAFRQREIGQGRCETLSILRDLRQGRREPVHLRRHGVIFF